MDSERQIVLCMQAAADDIGLVVPDAPEVRHIIGLGLPEAIALLFPDEPGYVRERIRRAYAHRFLSGAGGDSELFPGARELLHELRRAGWMLAIATGKSRLGLDRVLGQTGLTELFHATRCADETASKPDPQMLHELLVCLEAESDNSLMIGDTTYDLEMAGRAGIRSIGVTHGVHARAALEQHRPLMIVPDLLSLSSCLASF